MTVVVITPAAPVVALARAKAHLSVDTSDYDALITAYVAAATGNLDGPAGWLGRSLGVQTLELRLDEFCSRRSSCAGADTINLPYGPIIDIVSVKYDDADGAEQPVNPADYRLTASGLLMPGYGKTWPAYRAQPECVRVRYRAGYPNPADPLPDGDPVSVIPAPIEAAILLMTGDLFANRETVAVGESVAKIPMSATVENLLSAYRVFNV